MAGFFAGLLCTRCLLAVHALRTAIELQAPQKTAQGSDGMVEHVPLLTVIACIGVLFGGFGRKIDGFRFLLYLTLPGKSIYFP